MDRVFATAGNLSEFASGRHGDCEELALLAALHVVRPDDWPLTAASLERINTWMIANHDADNPSGAATPSGGMAFLAHLGVAASRQDVGTLDQLLLDLAGIHPIIFEYANAQALPGDEARVHYHYNTALGRDMDAAAFIFADGDNYSVRVRHGLGPLDRYTPGQIAAAEPCAVILIEEFAMIALDLSEVAKYFTASPDGSIWTCIQTGCHIRGGMLPYYRSLPSASGYAGLYELGLPKSDEAPIDRKFLRSDVPSGAPTPTLQRFERGVRVYDPQHLLDTPVNGFDTGGVYPAHIDTDPGLWP